MRKRTREEIIASLPPFRRGLREIAKAVEAEERLFSPRGQAGHKGGMETKARYPQGTHHLRRKEAAS